MQVEKPPVHMMCTVCTPLCPGKHGMRALRLVPSEQLFEEDPRGTIGWSCRHHKPWT
jgi:hypothetical protein